MHKLIEDLKTHANAADKDSANATLAEMSAAVLSDEALINEIIQPTVNSELRNLLIDKFGAHERAIQMYAPVSNEVVRALKIVKAFELGLHRAR
jgi:hypothetical protein